MRPRGKERRPSSIGYEHTARRWRRRIVASAASTDRRECQSEPTADANEIKFLARRFTLGAIAGRHLATLSLRTFPPTAHCELPTANCLLPTAYCHCPLPPANCHCLLRLPTAYCPLPLPTATAYCEYTLFPECIPRRIS